MGQPCFFSDCLICGKGGLAQRALAMCPRQLCISHFHGCSVQLADIHFIGTLCWLGGWALLSPAFIPALCLPGLYHGKGRQHGLSRPHSACLFFCQPRRTAACSSTKVILER